MTAVKFGAETDGIGHELLQDAGKWSVGTSSVTGVASTISSARSGGRGAGGQGQGGNIISAVGGAVEQLGIAAIAVDAIKTNTGETVNSNNQVRSGAVDLVAQDVSNQMNDLWENTGSGVNGSTIDTKALDDFAQHMGMPSEELYTIRTAENDGMYKGYRGNELQVKPEAVSNYIMGDGNIEGIHERMASLSQFSQDTAKQNNQYIPVSGSENQERK
jgi:hypothetical protein